MATNIKPFKRFEGTFPPEVAVTYNKIMTYFDYDKNIEIFDKIVKDNLNPKNNKIRVLEIGIGTGHFASRLKALGYEVYGIDDSYKMLEEMKKNYPQLNAKLQSVADLDFDGLVFDVIVSPAGPIRFNYYENERVFESYLPNWNLTKQAIERIIEHLQPEGLFIMSQNSDPEHPGFFKSTGDDMDVPDGMHYQKRESRDERFIYKVRKLFKGKQELWHIEHKFTWATPNNAEKLLKDSGFEIIGFDETNTYHASKKR